MNNQTRMGQIFLRLFIGIFLVIMCLLLIIMVAGIVNLMTSEKMGYVKVNCYDRYGNEIMNQTCEEAVSCGIFSKLFELEKCDNVYKISMKDMDLNKDQIFLGEKK